MDARNEACVAFILHYVMEIWVKRGKWVKEWLLKLKEYTAQKTVRAFVQNDIYGQNI